MTNIEKLIDELSSTIGWLKRTGELHDAGRVQRALAVIEAQEAKIAAIEALVGDYQTVGWIEREGDVAFVSVAEVRRILSVDAPTGPVQGSGNYPKNSEDVREALEGVIRAALGHANLADAILASFHVTKKGGK